MTEVLLTERIESATCVADEMVFQSIFTLECFLAKVTFQGIKVVKYQMLFEVIFSGEHFHAHVTFIFFYTFMISLYVLLHVNILCEHSMDISHMCPMSIFTCKHYITNTTL